MHNPTFPKIVFNTVADIKAHEWAGNHYMDSNAFQAVDQFVKRVDVSLDDKYEALNIMGINGMGLEPLAVQHPEMSKQDVLDQYLEDAM